MSIGSRLRRKLREELYKLGLAQARYEFLNKTESKDFKMYSAGAWAQMGTGVHLDALAVLELISLDAIYSVVSDSKPSLKLIEAAASFNCRVEVEGSLLFFYHAGVTTDSGVSGSTSWQFIYSAKPEPYEERGQAHDGNYPARGYAYSKFTRARGIARRPRFNARSYCAST